MRNYDLHDYIRYVHKEMSIEESKIFKEVLDNNIDLKSEWEILYEIKLSQNLNTPKFKKNSKYAYKLYKLWKHKWIFLALFISFCLLIFYHIKEKTPRHEKIYVAHFKPYPNSVTTRSSDRQLIDLALEAYDNKNYEEAETLLLSQQKLVSSNRNLFYLANAYLANSKTDQAISTFQEYIDTNEKEFIVQAQWYLALSYLKKGQLDIAIKSFEKITELDNESTYSEKAKEILSNLEE